jgi:hypothetical protein
MDDDYYLMPYIDIGSEVTDFGSYFRVGSGFVGGGTIHGAQSTCGATYHMYICVACEDSVASSNVHNGRDGEAYCPQCFSETFTYCAGCGEYWDQDHVQWVDCVDRYLCEDCRIEWVFECELCEITYPTCEAVSGTYICASCEEETTPDPVIEPVLETYTPSLFGLCSDEGEESV